MPDRDAPGPPPDRAPPHQAVLSRVLTGLLDDVQAHSGAVYVLDPAENVLVMTAIAGLPRVFAAPWERVGLAAPIPVADAARERRLVWVGGEEEMAGRYPRIAVVLPYPFALAALPVATADTVYGAVYATWPGSHPADLSRHERERLAAACDRLAEYMEWAAGQGRPVLPEPGVRPVEPPGEVRAAEAARMAARLPYGLCALDIDGRVEYANQASADLLGVPVERLLGTPPWVTLPWLNDPMYEDRYRAALLSQRITSFVALRPPGDWLSFRLYPSTTGLSVRITRARATPRGGRPQRDAGEGPGRLVTISHVLSLASALTEAVGVRDVIDLVADEIMPAVGSRTLVMLGSSGGRLHVLGQRGYEDPTVVDRFDGMPLTAQTPGVRALLTGVPGFYESRGQLERLYPIRYATPDGMAAWAYLPLVASGRAVGTWVLGYAEEHTFTAEERAVLTSVGGLIAQALERARLYDAKHRLAHGLQEALLPDTLPDLPGLEVAARYLPGTQGMDIGGDFYDLLPVGTAAAAVIGDVQGHNVTAAGLMGQVRTAVRAYTAVGQTPAGSWSPPTGCSSTSPPSASPAASICTWTPRADAPCWPAPDIPSRCSGTRTAECARWIWRAARCSASTRTPSTRPRRCRCRPAPSSRCTPTASSRSRASTSTSRWPPSPTGSPPRAGAPWRRSPTASYATSRRPRGAATTWRCCCSGPSERRRSGALALDQPGQRHRD